MFEDKKVLGIDIGSRHIKLALVKQGRQPELLAWAIVPTPEDCLQDGMVLNKQALAEQLKTAVKEHKLMVKKAAVNLNSSGIVVRELALPALKDKEIGAAVRFELTKSFPDMVQTHATAFKIYHRTGDELEGITTLCPRKMIDFYREFCEETGIPVKYMDVNANSLAKAYNCYVEAPQAGKSILLVDIRTNMSQVNVLQEGKIVLSRNITGGLASLESLLVQYFKMDQGEVAAARQSGYQKLPLSSEELNACLRIGYGALGDLIRQTLDFCRYNKVEEGIDSICLCGGGSAFQGLENYFSTTFNLPVHAAQPKHLRPEVTECFKVLMPAIGAALREDW
ncbi:type IV pilus assembly protein PilM [Desulfitobacterium sp.]|uniref:type IV pilus assembly protein PilM n=1 Tax=Desulfitobacterium sp. TaxID=49981 RepID=UPI002B1FEBE8|nr:type IV pilus assembly protein PilM [Desulfitobacterium sp.]MEA4901303.1 type IV pilus assembly protein PilM [Desulfitobacterium sp.]